MAKKSRTRKRLSREQIRDLDIEIHFLEGLVARDPDYLEAMKLLSDDYMLRGHFDLGVQLDEMVAEKEPMHPQTYFNLSCSYAASGQVQASADALMLAIDYGYDDWKWIARELSLESLRQAPVYQEILAKIQGIMTPMPKF